MISRKSFLSILFISIFFVAGLYIGLYNGASYGFKAGYQHSYREHEEDLVIAEYRLRFSRFKECALAFHSHLLSYVAGVEVSPGYENQLAERASQCRSFLDYTSEAEAPDWEDPDMQLAMVLLWWETYLRQSQDVLKQSWE